MMLRWKDIQPFKTCVIFYKFQIKQNLSVGKEITRHCHVDESGIEIFAMANQILCDAHFHEFDER